MFLCETQLKRMMLKTSREITKEDETIVPQPEELKSEFYKKQRMFIPLDVETNEIQLNSNNQLKFFPTDILFRTAKTFSEYFFLVTSSESFEET